MISGGRTLNQSDPTDNALAAIASILDQPEPSQEPEKSSLTIEEVLVTTGQIEADGYSKTGPGPIEAIRFKWTVRRGEHDEYFVDETIGENSRPLVSGPLTRDAAVRLVDFSEHEARRRFELLRGEMGGQAPPVAGSARKNTGEM
jgi:hypothetical protein